MKESGFAELMPNLAALYIGLSAGSMVLTPRICSFFVDWQKLVNSDQALGIVDFSIFSHLQHPDLPNNTMQAVLDWANELGTSPAYIMNDETAIKDDAYGIEVVSEGQWQLINQR